MFLKEDAPFIMLIYDVLKSSTYKNCYGHTSELPFSELDRYYILRAITKRFMRKRKILLDMQVRESEDAFDYLTAYYIRESKKRSYYSILEDILDNIKQGKDIIVHSRKF